MIQNLKIKSTEEKTLFTKLRDGFEYVAENANHVTINYDRLNDYIAALPDIKPANIWDADHHYMGDKEGTAAYVLILDAINFGSGYKPLMAQEGWDLIDGSIYFTVSTLLKNEFVANGPMTAEMLADISPKKCADILKLDLEQTYSFDFIRLCTLSLRELGQTILRDHAGSFWNFVNAAGGSSEAMVEQLTQLCHFQDEHDYHGQTVRFYKRAQIIVADLQLAFAQMGHNIFNDVEKLTMFPDNGVPHVLNADGILAYNDDLQSRVNNGTEIKSGSDEEIEIRACAAHVVELIAAKKNMSAMDVDHILWHKSVEDEKYTKETIPHRTLSSFY
jgi:hypothetical protein